MKYGNGDEYKGEWKDHQRHGKGKMKWANLTKRKKHGDCVEFNGRSTMASGKTGNDMVRASKWGKAVDLRAIGMRVTGKTTKYTGAASTRGLNQVMNTTVNGRTVKRMVVAPSSLENQATSTRVSGKTIKDMVTGFTRLRNQVVSTRASGRTTRRMVWVPIPLRMLNQVFSTRESGRTTKGMVRAQ